METGAVNKRCVVAVLDWGLGHATRSIPVIRQLLNRGCQVTLAGSGASLLLLQQEFPALPFFVLPAYAPVYPLNGSMVCKMAQQLPRFSGTILREHRALAAYMRANHVDFIISDNRYGCWSPLVRSVFITHQSNILMPRRFGWLAPLVRWANLRQIRKFDQCWIPDFDGADSISGELSSWPAANRDVETKYIGPLSRFKAAEPVPLEYDLVAICSGPEPQRTMFENILRKSLADFKGHYVLIRGVVDEGPPEQSNSGRIYNYMTADTLHDLLRRTNIVIARSGFSTVMDMAAMKKKVIFVPTPGQTEQEYLAERMMNRGVAFSMPQESFDLNDALTKSEQYAGFVDQDFNYNSQYLSTAIDELLIATR